jgi:hypothetical protein
MKVCCELPERVYRPWLQLAAVASLPASALAALPEVAEAHVCSARISLAGVWQKEFTIRVRTRKTAPAYTLEGYKLQAVLYGYSEIPLERYEAPLPRLAPGDEAKVSVQWKERSRCAVFDVQRPTGFSAFTKSWTP